MANWVDYKGYFGPDRRKARAGVRLRDRRHEDYAGRPPCLRTALRQLRMRVLEAHGQAGMNEFLQRLHGVILLAEAHKEPKVVRMLTSLKPALARAGARDIRQAIYEYLDRVQAAMDE